MQKKAWIVVGKIGSTYGVHGWLKIKAYTEFSIDLLKFSPWYLANNKKELLTNTLDGVFIEDGRTYGNGIIAKLKGFDSPEIARSLTGKLIIIDREKLPQLKDKEYYWSDLEGLTVINKKGEVLGKVSYLLATGSNDVLVVKGEKEMAIPYLPGKVILNVDLKQHEIQVDWEPI